MALQKQTVAFPFTKGIDRSRPASTLEPDQLADGINTEILRSGEISKRSGFSSVVATTGGQTPLALLPVNNAAGVTYRNLYSDVAYNLSGSTTLQQTPPTSAMTRPIAASINVKLKDLFGGINKIYNYDFYTDESSGQINVAVADNTTTAKFIKFDKDLNVIPFQFGAYTDFNSTNISVHGYYGLRVIRDKVLYYNSTGIYLVDFNTTGVASNTLIQTCDLQHWDACVGETNEFYLLYKSGANMVLSRRSYATGALLSSVTTSSTNVTRATVFKRFQVAAAADVFVGLLRSSGNKISLLRYNSSLTLQNTADQSGGSSTFYAITGVATSSPSLEMVVVELGNATLLDRAARSVRVYTTALTVLNPTGLEQKRAGLYGRAHQITSGQNPVVPIVHASGDDFELQNCYALMQLSASNNPGLHTIFSYGLAQGYPSADRSGYLNGTPLVNTCSLSTTQSLSVVMTKSESTQPGLGPFDGYVLKTATIEDSATYKASNPIKIGNQVYFANGEIYQYVTGVGPRESGFLLYPDPAPSVTTIGGGTIGAGTYSYVLVFEFIDENGDLIESAPSQPFSKTYVAGSRGDILYNTNGFSSMLNFNIVAYRTTNGGTIYYRLPSVFIGSTLIDDTADAVLTSGKILYTTGGVVENVQPHNCYWLSVAKRRLWTFTAGSVDTLWFTKEIREGFAPAFSDLLTLSIDRNYGELMGVASNDDNIIILKQQAIYVTNGDGPSDTLVGQFNPPASIAQGMGCINSRSIVETPQGVFFQSQEGIYIVDKGLGVSFIGQPLYKSEGTILTGLYDPALNRVLFLTTTDIWSYYMTTGTWHRWPVSNPVDMQIIDGQIYLLTTARILRQTAGIWQDNGVNYEQQIKLGQMQFSGIQGYQRVFRILIGGRQSDGASGNITAQTFFDYGATATDTFTIAQSATLTGGITRLEIRPSVQKCETMQILLSHTANNSGMTIDRVSAEVGLIGGIGRRAATGRAV